MKNRTIIEERLFDVPAGKVWKAITDRDEMARWYFDLREFRAEPGFQFTFTGGPSPEKQYVHLCEVLEVVPERKLSYSWRYEGYEGSSVVTFELLPRGRQTLLKLTHEGLGTFPHDNGDFAITNFEAGWKSIIQSSLAGHLAAGT
jgi:uncharacterized protein YndB with AHSA1/START domain